MRILITGAEGQLGRELARRLPELGTVLAAGRARLDLADPDAVRAAVREARPEVVLNCGAYTAVDRAESEPARAFAVNATAPGVLAEEAKRLGALLVHFSTDYVFDGAKGEPYVEEDACAPLNAYGRSKLAGEQAVAAGGGAWLVLRTSWVYASHGRNFLLTMRRLAGEREEVRVVDDQRGVPNWAGHLAAAVREVLAGGRTPPAQAPGIYHLTATGETTWFGFARAIFAGQPRPRVVPIATRDFPTPAARPAYGVLCGARLERVFGVRLPDWRDGLAACLAELDAA